jgi:hypothetical protein
VEYSTANNNKRKGATDESRHETSSQKYSETAIETAGAFGVSASSVSRHIVHITAKKLKEFKERDLSDFRPFAVFIDTIHRGGEAFMVCLGIDVDGHQTYFGFLARGNGFKANEKENQK